MHYRLQDFAYTISKFFRRKKNTPRPTPQKPPGACIQTPISAWLASVPTVLILRNTTGSGHCSLNRSEPRETGNVQRRPWSNRIDRNLIVNFQRPSAREAQSSADKNICRIAENRGLNRIRVKGVLEFEHAHSTFFCRKSAF